MKITKQKLINLIKEAIQEIDKSPAVEKAVQTPEPAVQIVQTIGYNDEDEIVAIFNFKWSFSSIKFCRGK